MAEFELRVATMRMDTTYSQIPAPQISAEVLDTLYAERTTELGTSSGTYIYDWMLTGTDFDPTSWYAVWVQGAFGGKASKAECHIQVVLGDPLDPDPDTNATVYGDAVARGYPPTDGGAFTVEIPSSQQASNINKVFIVQNPNQYDLGVRYLATTSVVYIEGLSIMAMRLGADKLDRDVDWFASQISTSGFVLETDVLNTQYTIHEADFTVTEPGDYILWSNCEVSSANQSGPEDRWINTEVNGTLIDTDWWYKQNKNAIDRHCYYAFKRVALTPGVTNIKIVGKAQSGGGVRSYYRPSLFLLGLSKFPNYTYGEAVAPWIGPLSTVHPSYTELATGLLSIPATDTNVLAWGGMQLRRGSIGGKMVRLRLDDVPFGDFMCDANTSGSIVGDEPYVYTFGMKTANLPVSVKLDATNGSAPLVSFPTNYTEYGHIKILALSTYVASGPVMDYTYPATDAIGVGEDVTPKSYVKSDNVGVGDTVGHSTTGTVATRPGTTYPRLWFGDSTFYQGCINARDANSAEWQAFEDGFTTGVYIKGYFEAIWYTLEFVFNGTSKATALSYLQAELRKDLRTHSVYDNYRLWAESARNIACSYDWLKAYSPADITTAMDEEVHNWMMLTSYMRYTASVPGNLADQILGNDSWHWASNNPYQNFYEGSMMAMAYAAITLENSPYLNGTANRIRTGAPAVGFEWPFNDGTDTGGYITWEIPFNDKNLSDGYHTDPWEFLIRRIEEMTLPALDTRVLGGDWLEGSNYGRGAIRRHMEMLNVMRHSTGIDYARDAAHIWHRNIPLAQIHNIQPGNSRLHFLGDLGGNLPMVANNYNRNMMLQCADALEGKIEGQYAQHWLKNVSNGMNDSVKDLIPTDFLMYRDRPSNNYTLTRNPWNTAYGTGTVNSRTNWLDDNTAVSFNQGAQDVQQGHTHHDQGGIQLWVGGQSGEHGWYLADQKIKYGMSSSVEWRTEYHNCVTFDNGVNANIIGQRFKDTGRPVVASLDRDEHTSLHTYTQVDLSNGYDVELDDPVRDSNGNITTDVPRGPSHYSDGDDDILAAYHRESVFLRSIGPYLVVYDRAEMGPVNRSNPFYSTDYNVMQMRQHWQFFDNTPVTAGTDSYRYDGGTDKRMFFKLYGHSSAVIRDVAGSIYPFYTMDVETGTSSTYKYKDLMTVFQPTTTATANATASEAIAGSDAAIPDSWAWGVCIKDAAEYQAILFTTTTTGEFPQTDGFGTPMLLGYTAPQGANNRHMICNLEPGQIYTVAGSGDGTTLTMSVTFGQVTDYYTASSAGVITFDPLALNTGSGDAVYTIPEGVGVGDPKQPMGIGYEVLENVGSIDQDAHGGPSSELYNPEDGVGLSETTLLSHGYPTNTIARVYDVFDYSTTGNPPKYKYIPTLTKKAFVVSALQHGWVGNPDNAAIQNNISNGVDTPSDGTYMVADGALSSSNSVILVFDTVTPPITPQRVRFRLRTREIEHLASPSLTIQAELYKPDATLLEVQTFSLGGGYNYKNINFAWIDYFNEDASSMYVILRAVSPTWDANTRVEVSEVELEFHYKGLEKVVGGVAATVVSTETTDITGEPS